MTAKERDEFIMIMGQEYPQRGDLLPIIQQLIKLAKRHLRLQEKACNEQVAEDHDYNCEQSIRKLCGQLPGLSPIFSGDPRGATVKLKVPSGRTNDWGAIGICIPT